MCPYECTNQSLLDAYPYMGPNQQWSTYTRYSACTVTLRLKYLTSSYISPPSPSLLRTTDYRLPTDFPYVPVADLSTMATEDARYRQSSQYRLWSFSPSHLQSLREKTNSLAASHIAQRLRTSSPPVDPLPEFLTPADEAMLLNFYMVDLLRAAQFCELPSEIQATAAIFLRRFYVTNSLMTYPPRALTMTCIFFACKAEGLYYRLQKFADKFPGTTGDEVLAAEYILCQGLRFAFDVRHPYRALEGAVMELRRLGDFDEARLARAHHRARDILKFSPLLTDAYFHYTPSQIMFAALSMADEGLLQRLLRDAFAGQSESVRNQVLETVQNCRAMLEKEPPERRTTYWDAVRTPPSLMTPRVSPEY